jgi:hypothetical protein
MLPSKFTHIIHDLPIIWLYVTLAATQLLNYLRNKSHSEKFKQKCSFKKLSFKYKCSEIHILNFADVAHTATIQQEQ